jgi:hypothetical protein
VSTMSDFQGYYILSNLSPSQYRVYANGPDYATKYYSNADKASTSTPVGVLSEVDTANIDFSLVLAGSISGKIMDNAGGAGLPGVTINVYNGNWEIVKSGMTDDSGLYSLAGIPLGNYYLRTKMLRYIDKYYNGSSGSVTPDEATTLAVTAGAISPSVDFGLDAGLALQGAVYRISDGAGIPGVYVDAYNDRGEIAAYARTDAAGSYSIEGLTAGQ